jgi:hypothetical protein
MISRYDPATHGPDIGAWINGRNPNTRVLVLPCRFDHIGRQIPSRLESPAFLNNVTFRGDPDVPTLIEIGDHGVLFACQPPLTLNASSYVVRTSSGHRCLATRADGQVPAVFDVTSSPLGTTWFGHSRATVRLDLDCPTGDLGQQGLFDLPHVGLRLIDDANGRRWLVDVRASRNTWDLSPPTVTYTIPWRKQTGQAVSLSLAVDLTEAVATLTISGEILTVPIRPGLVFPAIVNHRATIGGYPTFSDAPGQWSPIQWPIGDVRVVRFETITGARRATLNLNGAVPSVWANWTSGGPVLPIPRDGEIHRPVGGVTTIKNLEIRGNAGKPGVRVGQCMGRLDVENVAIHGCRAGIHKLPGGISYRHALRGVHFVRCGVDALADHTITEADDWASSYPTYATGVLPSSSVHVSRLNVAPANRYQRCLYVDGAHNGGMLSLRGGMLNREDGRVSEGPAIEHGGRVYGSVGRVRVEDWNCNVDPVSPTVKLNRSPAGPGDHATLDLQPWGEPVIEYGDTWTVDIVGQRPEEADNTEYVAQ